MIRIFSILSNLNFATNQWVPPPLPMMMHCGKKVFQLYVHCEITLFFPFSFFLKQLRNSGVTFPMRFILLHFMALLSSPTGAPPLPWPPGLHLHNLPCH